MSRFYGCIEDGRSTDETFRAAQLDPLRGRTSPQGPDSSYPFHWAAFTFIEDWWYGIDRDLDKSRLGDDPRWARGTSGMLTHLGPEGEARMVDVSPKEVTHRVATASVRIQMQPQTLRRIADRSLPKGDALQVARMAAVMGAKRTSDLIPLCHPLSLAHVEVDLEPDLARGVLRIRVSARAWERTGVEMEALVGAAVAALTIYDMAKAADRAMVIRDLRLDFKAGGKSGTFERGQSDVSHGTRTPSEAGPGGSP
jgi:cyclic pyranopterin phosphate synthase